MSITNKIYIFKKLDTCGLSGYCFKMDHKYYENGGDDFSKTVSDSFQIFRFYLPYQFCTQCHGYLPYQFCTQCHGYLPYQFCTQCHGYLPYQFCTQCHGDLPYQFCTQSWRFAIPILHTMSWRFGNVPNHCFPIKNFNEHLNL